MTASMFIRFIMAVATIVSVVLSAYVIPYIEAKFSTEQLNNLIIYIEKAVRCAEQIYSQEEWLQKKKYVLKYVQGIIGTLVRVELTDEQLDTLIEGIVNEVKKGA